MASGNGRLDDQPKRIASTPGYVTMSWQVIGLVAIVIAIASLGTLVVVTRQQAADLLATTALEVALIAFVVQILVFVAQQFASGRQANRSEDIYHQTSALLAKLEATTVGTHEMTNRIYDAISQRLPTVVADITDDTEATKNIDPEELRNKVLEAVREGIHDVRHELGSRSERRVESLPSSQRAGWLHELAVRGEVQELIRLLTSIERYQLSRLLSLREPRPVTLPPPRSMALLAAAGLITIDTEQSVVKLTDIGRVVAESIGLERQQGEAQLQVPASGDQDSKTS